MKNIEAKDIIQRIKEECGKQDACKTCSFYSLEENAEFDCLFDNMNLPENWNVDWCDREDSEMNYEKVIEVLGEEIQFLEVHKVIEHAVVEERNTEPFPSLDISFRKRGN